MSKKKKKNYGKNNKNKIISNKIENKNTQGKKVLDGVDLGTVEIPVNIKNDNLLINDNKEIIEERKQEVKEMNINQDKSDHIENEINSNKKHNSMNEHIQTTISILFTVVIFVALILLIYVIYNTYLKKDEEIGCDVSEVCRDYLKKDYGIEEESVSNFIKNIRGVIYNIDNFRSDRVSKVDLLNFATYFIWADNSEYLICDTETDSNCLTTKKEIKEEVLNNYFKKYLNIKNPTLEISEEGYKTEKIKLYKREGNVILTFSEFEYETLKHDVVDIRVDEDNVLVIFALSKHVDNTDIYSYIGYKKMNLKYLDERFIIGSIETSLN